MILWLPLVIFRPLIVGRNTKWLDGLLALAGVICILTFVPDFEIAISWQHLPTYVVLGTLLFVLSVNITTDYPTSYFRQVLRSIRYRGRSIQKEVAWSAVTIALSEEVVWRVVLQTVLSVTVGTFVSVAIVAASFTLLHRHRTLGFNIQFAELFIFSLILGMLFALTHDVMAVMVIHIVRNYLIEIREIPNEAR